MKKIFFICIAQLLLISCLGQKNKTITHNSTTMQYSVLTKDFEKFDAILYEQMLYEQKKKHGYNTVGVGKNLPTGTYLELGKVDSGAAFRETEKDAYFTLTKSYYPNNNIKMKGLYFNVTWGGFKKGIWYEFDQNGKLVKETDYDKPYKVTFEHILEFCKREGIEVKKGPILQGTGFHTMIKRSESKFLIDNSAIWEIEWLKKPDVIEKITLDGITGKVLGRKEVPYINN